MEAFINVAPVTRYTKHIPTGPTLEFAWSRRWLNPRCEKNIRNTWMPFKDSITVGAGNSLKRVQLSQDWTAQPLEVEVDRYEPRSDDKQHYEWTLNGERKEYPTPAFSIADPDNATRAIDAFLQSQMEAYIDARLQNAAALTRFQFETSKKHQKVR